MLATKRNALREWALLTLHDDENQLGWVAGMDVTNAAWIARNLLALLDIAAAAGAAVANYPFGAEDLEDVDWYMHCLRTALATAENSDDQ